ncbi:hypothetical protein GCM10023319_63050 [Nocardia iowensis]
MKVRHLAANPVVAFSYWSVAQHVVQGEAVATWVEDAAVKHRVSPRILRGRAGPGRLGLQITPQTWANAGWSGDNRFKGC